MGQNMCRDIRYVCMFEASLHVQRVVLTSICLVILKCNINRAVSFLDCFLKQVLFS